jgi:hypothetical protein
MRSLRPFILVAVACAGALLAACGSSAPPQPRTIPNPGIGASLSQVQKFFESKGGGQWRAGTFTGGIVGYATSDAQGACPVSLGGTTKQINGINLFCDFGGAISSNYGQARSIITATVDRFAPGASKWVRQQLDADMAPGQTAGNSAKKVFGKLAVTLDRGKGQFGELNLLIQPYQLVASPPGQTSTSS